MGNTHAMFLTLFIIAEGRPRVREAAGKFARSDAMIGQTFAESPYVINEGPTDSEGRGGSNGQTCLPAQKFSNFIEFF